MASQMNCNYCGQDVFEKNKCLGCGARSKNQEPLVRPDMRSEPFAYNGYIIWPLRDYGRDSITFSFWQGDKHCDDIVFSWEAMKRLLIYSNKYPIVAGAYVSKTDTPKFIITTNKGIYHTCFVVPFCYFREKGFLS